MKNPAEAVKTLLTDGTIGDDLASGTTGWRIACGKLPDVPDTVVVCFLAGGIDPFPHLLLNQPSVQVIVRGAKNGYQAAYVKIRQVVTKLLGMPSTSLLGDVYRSCLQIGDVIELGQDDNTRPLFSCNFRFIVEPAAETGETRQPIT